MRHDDAFGTNLRYPVSLPLFPPLLRFLGQMPRRSCWLTKLCRPAGLNPIDAASLDTCRRGAGCFPRGRSRTARRQWQECDISRYLTESRGEER